MIAVECYVLGLSTGAAFTVLGFTIAQVRRLQSKERGK